MRALERFAEIVGFISAALMYPDLWWEAHQMKICRAAKICACACFFVVCLAGQNDRSYAQTQIDERQNSRISQHAERIASLETHRTIAMTISIPVGLFLLGIGIKIVASTNNHNVQLATMAAEIRAAHKSIDHIEAMMRRITRIAVIDEDDTPQAKH